MDQNILVNAGHTLVKALDETDLKPRLAMWVHATDTDTWRLWIVPPKKWTKEDTREFYQRVSEVVSKNRVELGDIGAGDTEMILDSHPAVEGLRDFMKMPGLGSAYFSGNMFNEYYLPDGIILRIDL